jgi:putative transposase
LVTALRANTITSLIASLNWYLAYGLSLRDLKEMMAERGISIDHSTIHRWVVHFSPLLLKRFNRRKRAVSGRWHIDESAPRRRE